MQRCLRRVAFLKKAPQKTSRIFWGTLVVSEDFFIGKNNAAIKCFTIRFAYIPH